MRKVPRNAPSISKTRIFTSTQESPPPPPASHPPRSHSERKRSLHAAPSHPARQALSETRPTFSGAAAVSKLVAPPVRSHERCMMRPHLASARARATRHPRCTVIIIISLCKSGRKGGGWKTKSSGCSFQRPLKRWEMQRNAPHCPIFCNTTSPVIEMAIAGCGHARRGLVGRGDMYAFPSGKKDKRRRRGDGRRGRGCGPSRSQHTCARGKSATAV